ncbi:MAG: outer membrane beta-barrel protein [Gammaproteobacteria bacterium]
MSQKQRTKIFTFGVINVLLGYEGVLAQTATEQLVRDQRAVVRPRPDRGETVTNRPRPELDALGVRAASFFISPRLRVEESYDDNIFASDTDEKNDFVTLISPQLDIASDWNNHAFNVHANAAIGRYVDQGEEDFEDFSVGANGQLDITQQANLRAGVSYDRLHEGRGSPDDVRREGGSPPVEPTVFDVGSAFLTYEQWFGHFLLELNGAADQLDYDNVSTEDGGTINNDDRDRAIIAGGLKLGYEVIPGYTAFVRGAVDHRRYDDLDASNPLDRDSDGYLIEVGTDLDLTGVLFGDVAIGYKSQDYADPRFDTVGGVTGVASLTWTPTGLTTVSAFVTRGEIIETTADGAAAIFETSGRLVLDHELLRNLLLQARVSVIDDDFEGIDRSDTYIGAGFGANYLMNRTIRLQLGYNHLDRSSDAQGQDFTDNTVSLGVSVHL